MAKMNEDKAAMYLVAIVGVVAAVGIILLLMNTSLGSSSDTSGQVYYARVLGEDGSGTGSGSGDGSSDGSGSGSGDGSSKSEGGSGTPVGNQCCSFSTREDGSRKCTSWARIPPGC